MENLSLAMRSALSNYATFSGRAARPAYWWWVLSVFLLLFVLGLLDAFVMAPLLGAGIADENAGQPLSFLASLALLLPNISIGVRRLHDTGRTGWWMLLALFPVLGVLVLIYFYLQPSEEGENAHGPQPVWPPA
ncbi:DUF805 domain-containing protein [Dinoroseobacter sp. PD6]|uniref:DUF805 domain-containing protein n=1 Tax=Dinoroseobacter sp. PD6 TaxID=3028384 RepID=UPI00237ABE05|nr:DUF805 domain-containing protein [Dinoroseobacter sp. PD6]MDD9717699.1 DUF805 domain-containing protein [Dinoroseobacter sp. PD6]